MIFITFAKIYYTMKKIITLNFLFLICTVTFSQTWNNYKLGAEYLHGTIFKHNKHLENLVKGPVNGAELMVEFQTMGEKPWHQYYNFPVIGLGAAYLDLSNPDMLGQSFALYPYINIKRYQAGTSPLYISISSGRL